VRPDALFPPSLQDKVLHFWVNTAFATDNRIILPKAEIDKAAKDTKAP
jgi:hypothetical protein